MLEGKTMYWQHGSDRTGALLAALAEGLGGVNGVRRYH